MDNNRRRREVIAIYVTELELDGEGSAGVNRPGLIVEQADAVFDILSQAAAAHAGNAVPAILSSNGMRTYRE